MKEAVGKKGRNYPKGIVKNGERIYLLRRLEPYVALNFMRAFFFIGYFVTDCVKEDQNH
ncbi:hypothetical protein RhiirC2_763623 [Rhizophagus irregularis]|uniref:Uncharacterized protein n=1 Tax=Rhizophagus irregularis TaxID=588596 RepID=A0A2N1M8U7_9GLOM|nr:hypothetical protein RhiirC2_763623 [Rhizophagus irregularis]